MLFANLFKSFIVFAVLTRFPLEAQQLEDPPEGFEEQFDQPQTIPEIPESQQVVNSDANDQELFLVQGVPQTLEFDYDIGEIAIGNPSVASVVVDRPRRRIVVSPLETGETALLVFDTQGVQRDNIQITVTSTDLDQFIQDLEFLLRDIEGITARRVGRRVLLEGEVYVERDLRRIEEILRGTDFVVNLVTLSQDTQRILARRIKNEINLSGVEVDTVRDRISLRGEVASESEKERSEKIALIYVGEDRLVNVIAVNPDRRAARASRLVQVSAYFVELNKAFMRNFDFSWTPIASVEYGVQATGSLIGGDFNPVDQFQAVLTDFLPKLNTAKSLGVARIFENPTLSVKSGESASVNSGAQLLIPTAGEDGPQFPDEPTEIGVSMEVTPTADDRDFVDMEIGVDVSSFGSSVRGSTAGEGGSILLNSSSINTSHYVRSGETVALGGVIRSAFTDVKDPPPSAPFSFPIAGGGGAQAGGQSSVGNIFQVFKGRAINQNRSMFIVFITPEILVSARDSSRQLRRQMNLKEVEDFGDDNVPEGGF